MAEQDRGEAIPSRPWFAGKEGTLFLYRVNRRPIGDQPSLFENPQDDFLNHLAQVLLFGGEPVTTGHRFQREWFLGNRQIDLDNRTLAGQIGWERRDVAAADAFDRKAAIWTDTVQARGATARAPFAIDAKDQTLAVVAHPSFSPPVIPFVFTTILNQGEQARDARTTRWDVEPLLDEREFREWLAGADVVDRIHFVAKLPNPDVLDEFEPIFRRMEELKAGKIDEVIEARDPEIGLQNIVEEPTSRGFVAMAAHAYGYITARGRGRELRQGTTSVQRCSGAP